MKILIECESCEFHGTLTTKSTDISKADICFCPVCGADILQNYSDDEDSEEL
jgi:hypothetical protein